MKGSTPYPAVILVVLLGWTGFHLSGCPEPDSVPSSETSPEDVEEEYQLNAADVLFWDTGIPGADVPLVAQCTSDEDCAILEALPCRKLIHPTLLACVTINTDEGLPCELDNLCVTDSACNGDLCGHL